MSDSENQNGNSPKAGEAEYLKPETMARDGRPQGRTREAPVLDGVAEEVAGETKGASGEAPDETRKTSPGMRGNSNLLVAGGAGIGGAAAMLIALFALGVLPAADENDGQIAALAERIAEIEASNGAASQAASAQLDTLGARLDALDSQLAALAEAPDSAAAMNARIDNAEGELNDLKSALGDTRETMASLQQALGALDARMPSEGIGARVEGVDALVKALDIRLVALLPDVEKMEARVAALEKKEEDPDAAARAALGLALANLARAAEGAGSFETELRVMGQFVPDQSELAALADAAKSGVPTRAALEGRFASLAQSVFDAERRAGEDGLWSRFLANAKSLVTIRRTGEISGETTEAIVARMEERLKVQDLGGAVTEAELLAGPAAEAAAPWIADAKARLETDRLVRELSARLAGELAAARG